MPNEKMSYAGFWKRLAAFIIDLVIIMIGSVATGIILAFFETVKGNTDSRVLNSAGNASGILFAWLYYAAMESSSKQGTLGKMVLGIKVVDLEGSKIDFGKATTRYFGKFVSTIIFSIGFIMIAFTQKKQGLHDIMAKCLVLNK
ncbi:MAG: RDD family protein [Thermodesulfovibrionales bacterium]|nr:RDD family protein [Thermodesulfovibrionales bacterium]